MAEERAPELSIVVTIVDGGETLAGCLAALAPQLTPISVEVLVPWDASCANAIATARDRFAHHTWIEVHDGPAYHGPESEATRHERFDRRRSAGLKEANGAVIALVEDRGHPGRDWVERVLAAHATLPHAVIGGAIENAVPRTWQQAAYLCDFGRYSRPFAAHATDWVSDICVSYKREPLIAIRDVWQARYHEPLVHRALRERGETLWLTPEIVVWQHRDPLALGRLFKERFHWARLFAALRIARARPIQRCVWILGSPLLAPVLIWRILRGPARKLSLGQRVRVVPALFFLLVPWSAGELCGYLFGSET